MCTLKTHHHCRTLVHAVGIQTAAGRATVVEPVIVEAGRRMSVAAFEVAADKTVFAAAGRQILAAGRKTVLPEPDTAAVVDIVVLQQLAASDTAVPELVPDTVSLEAVSDTASREAWLVPGLDVAAGPV